MQNRKTYIIDEFIGRQPPFYFTNQQIVMNNILYQQFPIENVLKALQKNTIYDLYLLKRRNIYHNIFVVKLLCPRKYHFYFFFD